MTDVTTEPPRQGLPSDNPVARGLALGVGIHLLGQPLLLLGIWLYGVLTHVGSGELYFPVMYLLCVANVGITQWVYVLPTWAVLRHKGKRDEAKGLLIVAACLLAINGVCTGLMVAGG